MTRKDYVAIAEVFKNNGPSPLLCGDGERLLGAQGEWHALRFAMAKVLQADNPRFDCDRFFAACEGKKACTSMISNDNHIETALQRIFPNMNRPQSA